MCIVNIINGLYYKQQKVMIQLVWHTLNVDEIKTKF